MEAGGADGESGGLRLLARGTKVASIYTKWTTILLFEIWTSQNQTPDRNVPTVLN